MRFDPAPGDARSSRSWAILRSPDRRRGTRGGLRRRRARRNAAGWSNAREAEGSRFPRRVAPWIGWLGYGVLITTIDLLLSGGSARAGLLALLILIPARRGWRPCSAIGFAWGRRIPPLERAPLVWLACQVTRRLPCESSSRRCWDAQDGFIALWPTRSLATHAPESGLFLTTASPLRPGSSTAVAGRCGSCASASWWR